MLLSRSTLSVLISAGGFATVFLVAATCLWVSYDTSVVPITYTALYWYVGFSSATLAVAVLACWYTNKPAQRLIPRLYLLAAFIGWVLTHIATALHQDIIAVHYLHLLEAPLLFLCMALVAARITATFAPGQAILYVRSISFVMGLLVAILAPTTLNYSLTLERGLVSFTPGPAYLAIILAAFAIFFLSVCLIPLGRPRYPEHPSKSVGPLIFSEALQPQDVNVLQLLEHSVHRWRKAALKHGQWLSYRNHAHQTNGLVSSEPKSLENVLDALVTFARKHNTSHALNVAVHEDSRYPYLHVTIDYVGKKVSKSSIREQAEHLTELGAALTVSANGTQVELVVSFPLQW